jgi:plastocyanin
MRKSALATIGVILLVILAGILVFATSRRGKEDDTITTQPSTATNTEAGEDNAPAENPDSVALGSTIIYNGSTYTLSAETVDAGTQVKITNTSDQQLDFASDPHPTHTQNSELNAGDIGPGESKTITLNKTGTWGFHNHLNPSQKGSITVK